MKPVVQVGNLAEFLAEVPPLLQLYGMEEEANCVRLCTTSRATSRKYGGGKHLFDVPAVEMQINLQGVNAQGEIVWLMWQYVGEWIGQDHAAMNPKGTSVFKLLPTAEQLIRDWLTAKGYEVRGGQYALPKSVTLLRGVFECLAWIEDADAYNVELKA